MNDVNKMVDFDIEDIKLTLPHRFPMLLIDKVKEIVLDDYSVAVKNVSANEDFFNGHFQEKAIMPGVLIVEAMAQCAGFLVRKTLPNDAKLVYFMTIENAKFRQPVVPGDQLVFKTVKVKSKANVWKFSGVATVDGVKVAESVFSIAIVR